MDNYLTCFVVYKVIYIYCWTVRRGTRRELESGIAPKPVGDGKGHCEKCIRNDNVVAISQRGATPTTLFYVPLSAYNAASLLAYNSVCAYDNRV